MTGAAHDFLYRGTLLCERHDNHVGLFAPEIALVLKAFDRGQQLGIDGRCTECLADLSHGFADGIQECTAGIFHQMPSIRDLQGITQRLCCRKRVSSAPVTSNNLDLGISPQPGFCRRWLTIR